MQVCSAVQTDVCGQNKSKQNKTKRKEKREQKDRKKEKGGKKFSLYITQAFQPTLFTPARIINIIYIYHFMPLLMALTLAWITRSVESTTCFSLKYDNIEVIQSQHPDGSFSKVGMILHHDINKFMLSKSRLFSESVELLYGIQWHCRMLSSKIFQNSAHVITNIDILQKNGIFHATLQFPYEEVDCCNISTNILSS